MVPSATPDDGAWMDEFRSPSGAYRGKPFWSWNGKLEQEELLRQIGIFKEMGMGGAFLHSRTGLATEYLGEEWLALTNACADAAERLGLEAWLYDEDRWPSGSAGGLATKDHRHRMKYLRMRVARGGEAPQWPDEEHFVAAFAADWDGGVLGNYERVAAGSAVPEGRALLVFAWETMAPHSFYNGGAYLDTLSREATEHFLAITHERYRAACGDRLGRSIRGIFTDEPHRGFVFCDRHDQPGPADPGATTPVTPGLWAEFERAFGHDLRDRLPELFLPVPGRLSPVKWAYMEILQRMFLENWAKPLQARCREMGMLLTGHVLHEDSLAAQAVPCGSVMRYYEHLDWPGVDVLGLDNRNFWIVKQLASAARQTGKPWLLSELYGCTGWGMGFDGHKRIGDWQALLGINVRCHHLSWYSMAGESKRDYPASIFFQSAWHPDYEAVETYFARLHVLLGRGRPACDVLVLNPVESLWAQARAGWATWLAATDPDVLRLENRYRELFGWLVAAQIDFDYGDEEMLARLGSVAPGETPLRVGEMAYRTVVVCGAETIRTSTLDLLRRFAEAGGNLVFAGDPPSYLDAAPSPDPAALAGRARSVPAEERPVVDAVRAGGGESAAWSLSPAPHGLLSQVRIDGTERIAAMVNTDPERDLGRVTCRARATGRVVEFDALTGEMFSVPSRVEDGWLVWETEMPPLAKRVFGFGPGAPANLPARNPGCHPDGNAIGGSFAYELDEPNLCVLDMPEWKVGDGAWQPRLEVLKIEEAVCARSGFPRRSGGMVQPWASAGGPAHTPVPLALRHRFDVETPPSGPVDLLIEQPGRWQIALNGKPVPVPAETGWHIDPCFRRVPLPPGALLEGTNELLLTADFAPGTDLEAVYLAGRFGVRVAGSRTAIGLLPEKLAPGDIAAQGLPFYGGRIAYRIPWDGKEGLLRLPSVGAAAAAFRTPDGTLLRRVPWAPFECEIPAGHPEVIADLPLTRRNTFGPLHWTPPPPQPGSFGAWTGPGSFRTGGGLWSDDYQLVPAGLLAAPLRLRT